MRMSNKMRSSCHFSICCKAKKFKQNLLKRIFGKYRFFNPKIMVLYLTSKICIYKSPNTPGAKQLISAKKTSVMPFSLHKNIFMIHHKFCLCATCPSCLAQIMLPALIKEGSKRSFSCLYTWVKVEQCWPKCNEESLFVY